MRAIMSSATLKIPSELFATAESSHFDGRIALDNLTVGPDDYRFNEPIAWDVEVTNTGAAFLIAGKATGRGVCACARCLEDVEFSFEGDIEGYLLMEGVDVSDCDEENDDAPGDDEFDVLPADHVVDLEPLIKAALIVDAPYQPLCKDDCLGLCPNCGANLNDGPCSCGGDSSLQEFEAASNPFAALADFKFEGQ